MKSSHLQSRSGQNRQFSRFGVKASQPPELGRMHHTVANDDTCQISRELVERHLARLPSELEQSELGNQVQLALLAQD